MPSYNEMLQGERETLEDRIDATYLNDSASGLDEMGFDEPGC
jgi:hypothetical protein